MAMLTILPKNAQVEFQAGTTLLQALLGAGVAIANKCEGKAQCGACHLFIHDGRKSVSKIQRPEHEKLDSLVGVGSKSRLACQSVLGTEDVTVELLGFASGY